MRWDETRRDGMGGGRRRSAVQSRLKFKAASDAGLDSVEALVIIMGILWTLVEMEVNVDLR